ncbi:MAG: D-glycero-beta-D-manno-heptose 1-phosphate adenylyltransferase [Saprospiraceae bacterium]|nr:D-glycero-beta-D-manno-heptose 1-phosphate adenylyltransferase [Saprospiraceae bacterium]
MRIADKIWDREAARAQCRTWRESGERIVFTNGCFDILHKGHVHYLQQAHALGDRLVIGLNSDVSTRRLKGPDRPINHEAARAYVLAALSAVDAVVLFDEDTPFDLISTLLPDILVKGGDYRVEDVVGRDVVEAHGGNVVIIPFLPGYSTSAIEQKIRNQSQNRT